MVKDRIELAKHFNKLGFKKGAEIGVADGRYAEILCKEIPGLELYAVDPYAPYGSNWRNQKYQDEAFRRASKRLAKYNAVILRTVGQLAVNQFEDESLDFVFIDGDHHFDSAMEDIIAWSRKVKKGGIVSGHDYYQFKSGGIIPAVNAYVEAHEIDLNLTLRNPGGHKDDQCPCYWWVKE